MRIQTFVARRAVEALPVAILPGAAGVDVQRPHPGLRQPRADHQGAALWPVIDPDELGHAMRGNQLLQDRYDARPWQRGGALDGEPPA